MLLPELPPLGCPNCAQPLRFSLQGHLQAGLTHGVLVECMDCRGVWVHFRGDPPRFEPFPPKPRRRRKPKPPSDAPEES
jgi:hypothetical protein